MLPSQGTYTWVDGRVWSGTWIDGNPDKKVSCLIYLSDEINEHVSSICKMSCVAYPMVVTNRLLIAFGSIS